MNQPKDLEPVQSVLKMNVVVFDELTFQRKGLRSADQNVETNFEVAKQVSKLSEGEYRVTVRAVATREKEYTATVQISGFCSIEGATAESEESLLNNNAVAILFAYVRSELTLLTAQPGTNPIVLPVMNIAKMIEDSEK